jgi:hypothetical protein
LSAVSKISAIIIETVSYIWRYRSMKKKPYNKIIILIGDELTTLSTKSSQFCLLLCQSKFVHMSF